jgi:hypothetical protein
MPMGHLFSSTLKKLFTTINRCYAIESSLTFLRSQIGTTRRAPLVLIQMICSTPIIVLSPIHGQSRIVSLKLVLMTPKMVAASASQLQWMGGGGHVPWRMGSRSMSLVRASGLGMIIGTHLSESCTTWLVQLITKFSILSILQY